jgi:hypothetical protein
MTGTNIMITMVAEQLLPVCVFKRLKCSPEGLKGMTYIYWDSNLDIIGVHEDDARTTNYKPIMLNETESRAHNFHYDV